MFSERSGVVNIALEGIMIIGAFTGIFFISRFGNLFSPTITLFIAIIISALSGLIFSLLYVYASINMSADQVISGTASNNIGARFCSMCYESDSSSSANIFCK